MFENLNLSVVFLSVVFLGFICVQYYNESPNYNEDCDPVNGDLQRVKSYILNCKLYTGLTTLIITSFYFVYYNYSRRYN